MITLTLPFGPSVNHYKTIGRLTKTPSGKIYQKRINSPVTKRFFQEVWHRIRDLKASTGFPGFAGATISVEVYVYPPDKRKRDLDGILKVLLDAMQWGGLYDDDYQIARLFVERCDIIREGQIVVRVKPLE